MGFLEKSRRVNGLGGDAGIYTTAVIQPRLGELAQGKEHGSIPCAVAFPGAFKMKKAGSEKEGMPS